MTHDQLQRFVFIFLASQAAHVGLLYSVWQLVIFLGLFPWQHLMSLSRGSLAGSKPARETLTLSIPCLSFALPPQPSLFPLPTDACLLSQRREEQVQGMPGTVLGASTHSGLIVKQLLDITSLLVAFLYIHEKVASEKLYNRPKILHVFTHLVIHC